MHVITYALPSIGNIACHVMNADYLHDIIVNLKYILSRTYSMYTSKVRATEGYLLGAEVLLLPPASFIICGSILVKCALEPPMVNTISIVDDTHVIESPFICKIYARRATAEEILSGKKMA